MCSRIGLWGIWLIVSVVVLAVVVGGCGKRPNRAVPLDNRYDARLDASLIDVVLRTGGMRVVRIGVKNLSEKTVAHASVGIQVFNSRGDSNTALYGNAFNVEPMSQTIVEIPLPRDGQGFMVESLRVL